MARVSVFWTVLFVPVWPVSASSPTAASSEAAAPTGILGIGTARPKKLWASSLICCSYLPQGAHRIYVLFCRLLKVLSKKARYCIQEGIVLNQCAQIFIQVVCYLFPSFNGDINFVLILPKKRNAWEVASAAFSGVNCPP